MVVTGSRRAVEAVGAAAARMRRRAFPLLLVLAAACGQGGGDSDISANFSLDPAFPSVGTAKITVSLVDGASQPLAGGTVSIEGNMSHAGMTPTFAELTEAPGRPGTYTGQIEFTMGGDWILLMEAHLPDGRVIERQLPVPGVQSK